MSDKMQAGYAVGYAAGKASTADAIERLEAENARLREALSQAEYALGNYVKPDCWRDEECFKVWGEQWLPIARAALSKQGTEDE